MDAKDHQKEKSPLLDEVANVEKQFVGMIHSSKDLWRSEVQLLYKTICSCYEKLLLGDHKLEELQDVEYSLWKLHYRLIDEFRKRSRRIPANGEAATESVDGFKSFLSEASLYYQNLIVNLRKSYGLGESFTVGGDNGGMQNKKLQFLWHRFLVCLGDLARYKEQQCEKSGQPNWSVPASHYLEATMVWPYNGNPHNQLAVLATYIGDEFLALYHCIRSLAVKEPFPDAWNNLLLLCEKNRSSPLASISSDADFDILKAASSGRMKSDCKVMKERQEEESSSGANLWSLIIRVISFFFLDSSLEEFPSTFASAIKELETLLSLDDKKLKAAMESYHYMDSTRTEPFRLLQVVCIFIFVIEHLRNSKEEVNEAMQRALSSAFMVMGRLVDRCSKAKPSSACTLSPAVLVFIEWLVTTFEDVEKYVLDDGTTVAIAISYFFSSLHDLLKKLDAEKIEGDECEFLPLWEDHELRGFAPLSPSHAAVDFSLTHHQGPAESFEYGKQHRARRIINAAKKISLRTNDDHKSFIYDSCSQRIDVADGKESAASKGHEKAVTNEKSSSHQSNGKSGVGSLDEEEVILFKPLTRHNSEPIYKCFSNCFEDPMASSREAGNQAVAADECLRRATSLLIAQNQAQGGNDNNGFPFHSDLTNFRRNNNLQQPMNDTVTSMFSEPSISASFGSTIGAGPPSLNAWVSPSSFGHEKTRGKGVKQTLPPIEEAAAAAASSSLSELSISKPEENTITSSGHLPYSPPLPSAPFLPDDDAATWLGNGNIPTPPPHFSDHQHTPPAGFSNWNGLPHDYTYYPPGFTYPLLQQQRRMTSAEWLRQYREHNHRANGHMWQPPSYASPVSSDLQWGISPPLSPYDPPSMMQPAFSPVHGYFPSRQGTYWESSLSEPEPLLQYLKEKEWLIHHKDSNFRGPTFMGS